MDCKNCGKLVEGKYCSNCGQDSKTSRITIPNFLSDISESVFQINKGLFFTTKELFLRPGNSIREYLSGKRKNHFKPIAYLLLLSTVYFLITKITNQNTWIDDGLIGWMEGSTGNSEIELPKIVTWFVNNYAYSTLLLLPIFSLASYLSFYKSGENYLEHIVINSYITGFQALIYSFFALVKYATESEVVDAFPLFFAVGYTFWVFSQIFSDQSRVKNILSSFLTYFLYLVLGLVILFILTGISELR